MSTEQKNSYLSSSYSEWIEDIRSITEYDCSVLSREQMDFVGMAFENAVLFWESAEGKKHFDSENECIAAYVEGAFDELKIK